MSCIVAIRDRRGIVVAGDSSSSTANQTMTIKNSKVFTINSKIVIGFVGDWKAGQVIRENVTPGRHAKSMTDLQYIVRVITKQMKTHVEKDKTIEDKPESLIAYNGKIFRVEADWLVAEIGRPYDSIGAGEEYAIGSLITSDTLGVKSGASRAYHALAAASKHCPWVSPPFYGVLLTPDGPVPLRKPRGYNTEAGRASIDIRGNK